MISLSAYGQPPNNLYTAVWVQRSGSSWQAIHEASASAYQSWFDTNNQAGYVSTIVTVTGPSSSPVYAGVMEKNGVTDWYQKCGLTNSQYYNELNSAQINRFFLKSFAEYGSASDRRYCGIWYYNQQYDKYTAFVDDSYNVYQTTFNAETTKPYWRPSYLSVSEDHLISSAFVDTDIGPWVARHAMTASDLQAEYETQSAAGYYIVHLQGGGTGSNANYAAIFATQDIPTPRSWRVTGSVTGFQNNNAAANQADSLMQSFMQANGIRQAQFTVGLNGNIILQRAYSWSESTRHTTSTSDVFLLASISKMFLEAAVQTLYDRNLLTPSTLVYPLLGYTNTPDARLQQITVDQLLTHYGGLDDSQTGFDPAYSMRQIAITQGTGANPATIKDIVDYMSRVTLDFNPGARYAYSNYGYILLSYLVEYVTGQDYYAYLKSAVLEPGGYDVRQWTSSPSAHANDPITQESRNTGLSAAQPQSQLLIADIFSGDGMYKENDYGGAALAASATTLVNFIHTHAVWGIGGRQPGSWAREGSTPGTETWASSLQNGIDYSVVINTRDFPSQSSDLFADVLCPTTIPNFLNANPTA
ncbi:penicillin-binding protein [Gymnopilus junonius]|uniref:Penicillin-binding protein n=1 Tax=Gymnopilus junonius TaxID=109634 RepID=A0A9P5TTG8_GYMJU|nr:penicillin-binding protein [Gymnopilus junonius]